MTIKSYKELSDEFNYIHYIYSNEAKVLKLAHLFYVYEVNPKTFLKIKAKIKNISVNVLINIPFIEFTA